MPCPRRPYSPGASMSSREMAPSQGPLYPARGDLTRGQR
jgi:hypothetical protein